MSATVTSRTAAAGGVSTARPAAVPRHRRHRWHAAADITAIVFSVIWIFPVYWMVNTSFKPRPEVMSAKPIFFPEQPTLQNYIDAISQTTFWSNLKSSVLVVVTAVVVGMIVALFASAALSRFRFVGRRTMMVVILAVQMLPGTALLIPQFLIANNLGLTGRYIGLILAYIAMVLPFSVWVMRGFYVAIPVSVEEAAMVDGANTWQIMWRILFPLVMPGLVAGSIFGFISAWNEYLIAYTFMKSNTMYTLPVWLQSFSTPTTGTDFGGQMAASVLFALPVVVFFMIIQRNLVTGMSAGAVKG